MTLFINNISFQNFRNYENFEMKEVNPLTIFIGPNAIGKTNIIEGIQLLTSHTSFRNPINKQLLYNDSLFSILKAGVKDEKRDLLLELQIEENRKKFLLNEKNKKSSDLKGLIPSVIFTPDDLEIIKGSMSIRRSTLDSLGFQLSKNHYLICKDYEKVLKHKNQLLKEDTSSILIESINEVVVTCGAQLSCYRAALLKKLLFYVKEYYKELTQGKESLHAVYIPSWEKEIKEGLIGFEYSREEARDLLKRALEFNLKREKLRKRALIGPQADKIEFFINGKNASLYGSQGQQRSIVLALKLAEISLIQEMLNQKPVLLLDDVMSELDSVRRNSLINLISQDIQTFITTTNLMYFEDKMIKEAHIVDLKEY